MSFLWSDCQQHKNFCSPLYHRNLTWARCYSHICRFPSVWQCRGVIKQHRFSTLHSQVQRNNCGYKIPWKPKEDQTKENIKTSHHSCLPLVRCFDVFLFDNDLDTSRAEPACTIPGNCLTEEAEVWMEARSTLRPQLNAQREILCWGQNASSSSGDWNEADSTWNKGHAWRALGKP